MSEEEQRARAVMEPRETPRGTPDGREGAGTLDATGSEHLGQTARARE